MRRFGTVLFSILLAVGAVAASAQAVPSATGRQASFSVGGMGSISQPDYEGGWAAAANPSQPCPPVGQCAPVATSSGQALFGAGVYADLKVNRWVQIEGEARWQRWNQFAGIHQDNYLIGPRLPIHRFGKATVYGKTLFGFSKMDFGSFGNYGHGNYTDFAFGGGVDWKLSRRLTFRPADFEYQYWPWWGNSNLKPYGASMGLSYRIF